MERRDQLLAWIEDTRRLQRRMALVFGGLGVVALGLWLIAGRIGGLAVILVAAVSIVSFWVTAAHNAAHRHKLDELAALKRSRGPAPMAAHRRWQPR